MTIIEAIKSGKDNDLKKESLSSGELMLRAINWIKITDADWLRISRQTN